VPIAPIARSYILPSIWTAGASLAGFTNVRNWKDLSPRVGFAYDLFGSGKTAVRASASRYVDAQTVGFAANANLIDLLNNSENLTWTDNNGDFMSSSMRWRSRVMDACAQPPGRSRRAQRSVSRIADQWIRSSRQPRVRVSRRTARLPPRSGLVQCFLLSSSRRRPFVESSRTWGASSAGGWALAWVGAVMMASPSAALVSAVRMSLSGYAKSSGAEALGGRHSTTQSGRFPSAMPARHYREADDLLQG
jgi:hypothetical protein